MQYKLFFLCESKRFYILKYNEKLSLEGLVCDKCSLPVPLYSSNSVEKLCDEWVLSASVCVARSPVDFCSATTEAERRPLVFSVPIPLRTQRAKAPTRPKIFCRITETNKIPPEHLFQTPT